MSNKGVVTALAVVMALVATGALFLYVNNLRTEAESGAAQVEVIVSKEDIPAGTRLDELISEGSFTTQTFDEDAVVEGAITELSDLEGHTTSVPIVAGEQITRARFQGSSGLAGGVLGIPGGTEALTLSLEPQRIIGRDLQRGDRVSIYGTWDPPGGDPFTSLVVSGVRVLKVSGSQSEEAGQSLVTLALKPADAQEVIFGQEDGTVFIALLPPGQDGSKKIGPVSYPEVSR